MKLNEKIYTCRKKAGLSQEALAERIGVSRQAISKWETGEASPEISKLPLLAKTFGVTADWLLDESEEPEEDAPEAQPEPAQTPEPVRRGQPYAPEGRVEMKNYPDWVDKLPGFLARMIRLYGWLVGVRVAIAGALFTAMGFVAKAMFGSMFSIGTSGLGGFGSMGGVTAYDSAGNVMDLGQFGLTPADLGVTGSPFGGMSIASQMNAPADIFCNFVIVLGVAMLIGGAVLAWYLRKWASEN
ncbi:MAG: helix-turn-helix transcriptional regulator [Clostridia bacterium]|nr:helix-turn-helix transcriptional regulator [Clostridia bacterium]